MIILEKEKISQLAAGILQGLEEATADAKGLEVEGMKKTVIHREQKISAPEKISKKFIMVTGKNLSQTL